MVGEGAIEVGDEAEGVGSGVGDIDFEDFGCALAISTPLLQINFAPRLVQVYFFPR